MSTVEPAVPAPGPDDTTCSNCGGPLAAGQRYCLACGQPCSPVRLAFLDVLQGERDPHPTTVLAPPPGYPGAYEVAGPVASLRRYSGLLSLCAVMLLAIVVGLLVGHWITQNGTPSRQVLTIKGLTIPAATAAAPAAAAAVTPAATTAATSGSTAGKSTQAKTGQAKTGGQAKATTAKTGVQAGETSAKTLPAPVKQSSSTEKKVSGSTGKKHVEAVNEAEEGLAPIETGG